MSRIWGQQSRFEGFTQDFRLFLDVWWWYDYMLQVRAFFGTSFKKLMYAHAACLKTLQHCHSPSKLERFAAKIEPNPQNFLSTLLSWRVQSPTQMSSFGDGALSMEKKNTKGRQSCSQEFDVERSPDIYSETCLTTKILRYAALIAPRPDPILEQKELMVMAFQKPKM